MSEGHEHDADAQDVSRDEDGLRVVPEGYDPQQVHELLAGYKEQMDRLEQVLGSVQAALGVTGEEAERVPGEQIDPPDARALQLAADYRPSTLRFDPGPISSRVAPGAPLPVRPRSRNTGLFSRMALEGAFIVVVILALAVLQEPPRVLLLGAIAAWLGVILVVEVLLARIHARIAAPATEAVVAPPAARPDVVALRLPHPPPPPPEAPPEQEPVNAVTGPDDVWVVPQEVLIAEPAFEDFEPAEPTAAAPVLEDTLETDLEVEDVEPVAEAIAEELKLLEAEEKAEAAEAEARAAAEKELAAKEALLAAEEAELAAELAAAEARADAAREAAVVAEALAVEADAGVVADPKADDLLDEPGAAAIAEAEEVAAAEAPVDDATQAEEPEAHVEPEPEPEATAEADPDTAAEPSAFVADDVGWDALEAAVDAGEAGEPEQLPLEAEDTADDPDVPTEEDAAPPVEDAVPPADAVPTLPRPERPASVDWPEAPLSTDSWEPLFEPEPVAEAPAARWWPFGRHTPEPAARRGVLAPPDPELSRAAQPLPPVLIDPHADGSANGKRRSRRRRG